MRLLIVPTYEYATALNADSSYLLTKAWIEAVCRLDPNVRVTWVVPDPAPGDPASRWEARYEPLEASDRVELLQVPMYRSRDLNEVILDRTLFELVNPWRGTRPCYDVIITNNAGKGFALAEVLRFTTERPFVVIWDFSTRFRGGACELDVGNDAQLVQHMMGYALADETWFFSEYARQMAARTARELLAPALVDSVLEKSLVFPVAINRDRLDRIMTSLGGKRFDRMTCYFGGRFTRTKGGEFASKCYSYAFRSGRAVDIQITVPSGGRMAVERAREAMGEIVWHYGLTQDEAWEIMARSHMSLFPQSIKMVPAACFEQIYAGLAVVVNAEEAGAVLGPDYPYLFRDPVHAYALLQEIVDDYDAAQAKLAGWRERVGETFDIETNARRMLERLCGLVESQQTQIRLSRIGRSKSGYQAIVEEARQAGVTHWEELKQVAFQRNSFKHLAREIFTPGTRVSLYRLYMEARDASAEVLGAPADPVFRWR